MAILLISGSAIAVTLVSGPEVQCADDQATIRWQLDTEAGARVRYGTKSSPLDQRAQGPVGTEHIIVLDHLRPGTTYFYTVGTARLVLATNSFTTPGGTAPPLNSVSSNSPATPGPTRIPSDPQPQAPPTRATWNDLSTLQDHFDRHGSDFGAKDPDDYARKAWFFLQEAKRESWPAKRDAAGNLRVWNPKTRAFASYTRAGKTRTYFKATRPGYFDDQPGTPVNLKAP